MHDISGAIMMYRKANLIKFDLMVEDTLKELLYKKGLMLLEQGECNDFLEDTLYENFSYTLQTSLLYIYYN